MIKEKVLGFNLVTHSGGFHLDELAGKALLRCLLELKHKDKDLYFVVHRIPYSESIEELDKHIRDNSFNEENISDMDFVLDTGRVNDGIKYFDHHQYKGGLSSAGLVYKYCKEQYEGFGSKELDKVISIIDQHDVGDRKGKPYEIHRLISSLNDYKENTGYSKEFIGLNNTIHSTRFSLASEVVYSYIKSLVEAGEKKKELINKIETEAFVTEGTRILFTIKPGFDGITSYLTGEDLDDKYDAIAYPKDDVYIIKTFTKTPDTYDKVGIDLPPHESMEFVHKAGFIGKANDVNKMLEYLVYLKDFYNA